MNDFPNRFTKSQALFSRAEEIIPCGIYGHATPAMMVPGAYPYYAERALGARYWDADENEYIDWLSGYGPIILGHQHPVVEEAAANAQRKGLCFNHPTETMVELGEYLVDLIDFASWVVFAKNGSDMTTWAVQVAREHTQRKKILKVANSYHGIDPWCTPGHAGLIAEDKLHIHEFIWNDLNSFESQIKTWRNQIAAVIFSPFHHPAFSPSELPHPDFLSTIEQICRREGILLILDDIRAGFRLHHGGSHRYFGFEPDLICLSKAIANGHPLSVTLGRKELRIAASRVFLTGSYWYAPGPMAAALACLKQLEKEHGVEKMRKTGERLMHGLVRSASDCGFEAVASGPPALPLLTFKHDAGLHLQQKFCTAMVNRGIFLHPHHNWFISCAHTNEEVDSTIKTAEDVFAILREKDGL